MSRALGISSRTSSLCGAVSRLPSRGWLPLGRVVWRSSRTISSTTTTNKRLERTTPPKKGKGAKSKIASTASSSTEGVVADGPKFVQRPKVSAKEMVAAIVSRSNSKEPFSAAADPFANQLDSAIRAGLKNIPGRRDSRYNRANPEPATGSQLPDIQAQYLVGSARWESVNANEVKIKSMLVPLVRTSCYCQHLLLITCLL